MSDNNNHPKSPQDPFSQFWGDIVTRMGASAPTAMPGMGSVPMTPEAAKQMQRVFLDAMAKYFDDFMRSDQFLTMMKETMDRSLGFKQQVDQFLTQLYRGVQAPAKADVDDIAGLLRSVEKNVLDRLARLEDKVAAVEDSRPAGASAGASRAQHPSGREDTKNVKAQKKSR